MKKSITIKIENKPERRGHQSHRSGSGEHDDKRTKRLKTRSDRTRQSIKDQSDGHV
jgi:hypothetical protein